MRHCMHCHVQARMWLRMRSRVHLNVACARPAYMSVQGIARSMGLPKILEPNHVPILGTRSERATCAVADCGAHFGCAAHGIFIASLGVSPTLRNYTTQVTNIYIRARASTQKSPNAVWNLILIRGNCWPQRGALSVSPTLRNYNAETTNIYIRAGASTRKSPWAV